MDSKGGLVYCDVSLLIEELLSKGKDELNIGYKLYHYKDLPKTTKLPEDKHLSLVLTNPNKENEEVKGYEGVLDKFPGTRKKNYVRYPFRNKHALIFIILDGLNLFIYVRKKKKSTWSQISKERFENLKFRTIKRKHRTEMAKAYHSLANVPK